MIYTTRLLAAAAIAVVLGGCETRARISEVHDDQVIVRVFSDPVLGADDELTMATHEAARSCAVDGRQPALISTTCVSTFSYFQCGVEDYLFSCVE